jgi:putative nucleotidyltransferase with HDIG domain
MNSRSEQIQVLYEIVTSIDSELDLQDMLKKCLSRYVRKLNSSAGAVLKLNQYGQGENYYFKEIVSIPRRIHNNPAHKDTIRQIPQEPNKQTLNEFYKHLPISLHISENQHCYIMNLPGFGLIIFLKGGEPLKVDLLNSLLALNNKIAYACKSCLNIEALRESRQKFHSLFSEMAEGVYLHKIIYNKKGEAINYRIIDANPASEMNLEIKVKDAIGKLATELYGTEEAPFIKIYAKVAETGKPISFEKYFPLMKKHFYISVYSPEKGKFATVFTDITERKQAEEKLQKTINTTIDTMSNIIEAKDPYTFGHQHRVCQLAVSLAQEMKLPQDKIEGIRIASLIHDIGKIGLPAEILSKPTKLSDMEFNLIKSHSQIGYDILKSIEFPWPIAQIVLQHHEKVNGSGYPRGLKGDGILLEARIICVADVVEAMSSHRPYRPALGIDKALEEISQNKGILYDPEVVDTCIRLFKEKEFKFE